MRIEMYSYYASQFILLWLEEIHATGKIWLGMEEKY